LVARRPEQGVWAGLWEFPQVAVEHRGPQELAAHLKATLGVHAEVGKRLLTLRHGIMNWQVTLHVYGVKVLQDGDVLRGYAARRWATTAELAHLPLSAPHRRIAAWLEQRPETGE